MPRQQVWISKTDIIFVSLATLHITTTSSSSSLYPHHTLSLYTSMDVNFSAKSQALTLISCTPLYSSPSPSSSFSTLRREFLGCGHNLRPPGLRSPKKCKNIRFRIQSPSRFYFKASLGSQPVLVVVAVAAVFAFSVVFLSYSRRRKNSREVRFVFF